MDLNSAPVCLSENHEFLHHHLSTLQTYKIVSHDKTSRIVWSQSTYLEDDEAELFLSASSDQVKSYCKEYYDS